MRCPGQNRVMYGRWQQREPRGRQDYPGPAVPAWCQLNCLWCGGAVGLGKPSRSHDMSVSHGEDLVAHGVCKRPVRERTSDETLL